MIRKDLRVMGIKEDKWYDEAATSRSGWKSKYRGEIESRILIQPVAVNYPHQSRLNAKTVVDSSGEKVTKSATSVF